MSDLEDPDREDEDGLAAFTRVDELLSLVFFLETAERCGVLDHCDDPVPEPYERDPQSEEVVCTDRPSAPRQLVELDGGHADDCVEDRRGGPYG